MSDGYAAADKLEAKVGWDSDKLGVNSRPSDYGLCSRCNSLAIRKTKLFDGDVWCNRQIDKTIRRSKLQPNRFDPVVECSDFYPIGMMDLFTMNQIAFIIDIKKNKVGFGGIENIVTITEPSVNKKDE